MEDALRVREAEGRAEGKSEGKLEDIVNLMDSLGFTVEQAMSALKISASAQPEYQKMLKNEIMTKTDEQ